MTATGSKKGFIDQYFGGEYIVEMKCTETEDEEVTKSTETFYQLSCFIEKGIIFTIHMRPRSGSSIKVVEQD